MGFKDWFVDDSTGNESVKVQCSGCNRVTVVKIPSGKSFEKWNKDTKCGQCNASSSWSQVK